MWKFIKKELQYISMLLVVIMSTVYLVDYSFNMYHKTEADIIAEQKETERRAELERPATDYMVYYWLYPEKEYLKIGEDLYFISDNETFEYGSVTWEEVLRCDLFDGEGYRYFSYYESKSKFSPRERKKGKWKYNGAIPSVKSKCYIDGVAVIITQAGDTKQLLLESTNVFFIE